MIVLGLLVLLAAACSSKTPAVRVGSKNFSEQVLLGEIAAQALEAEGVRVDRRLDLGRQLRSRREAIEGPALEDRDEPHVVRMLVGDHDPLAESVEPGEVHGRDDLRGDGRLEGREPRGGCHRGDASACS